MWLLLTPLSITIIFSFTATMWIFKKKYSVLRGKCEVLDHHHGSMSGRMFMIVSTFCNKLHKDISRIRKP